MCEKLGMKPDSLSSELDERRRFCAAVGVDI